MEHNVVLFVLQTMIIKISLISMQFSLRCHCTLCCFCFLYLQNWEGQYRCERISINQSSGSFSRKICSNRFIKDTNTLFEVQQQSVYCVFKLEVENLLSGEGISSKLQQYKHVCVSEVMHICACKYEGICKTSQHYLNKKWQQITHTSEMNFSPCCFSKEEILHTAPPLMPSSETWSPSH